MRKILITAGKVSAKANLFENPTADALWNALPIESTVNTWGEEIYFAVPVRVEQAEDAVDSVEKGDLAYWPPGSAFCVFFGRTPASRGDEPRAASPVNRLGRVEGDPGIFKNVKSGAAVRLEKAGPG